MYKEQVVCGCPYGSWKHDTEKELKLLNNTQRKFISEYFRESYKILGIEVQNEQNR